MPGVGQRAAPRKRVSIPAVVTAPGLGRSLSVLICDASADGCQLISEDVASLPDVISLAIQTVSKPLDGRIVWRRDNRAGVSFAWRKADAAPASDEPLEARIAKEIVMLSKQLC